MAGLCPVSARSMETVFDHTWSYSRACGLALSDKMLRDSTFLVLECVSIRIEVCVA